MQRLNGIGVSSGVGAGRAVILIQRTQVLRFSIPAPAIDGELQRMERARVRSADQLDRIQARLPGHDLGALFEAQRLMLDDPMLLPAAAALIREQRVNAEWALNEVFDRLASVFDGVEDRYLRERKGDLSDIVGRLRMNLTPGAAGFRDLLGTSASPCVLVADELPPSVAAQLDWSAIQAFVTDAGSRTYHTAILARSLHVPAVVGLHDATNKIAAGAFVIVDGDEGSVSIDPPEHIVGHFLSQHAETKGKRIFPVEASPRPGPAMTADGVRVTLAANVDLLGDIAYAKAQGAEGIGLYRSELLLAGRTPQSVTEDTQCEVYTELLREMHPAPVTVRTFDIDEDQLTHAEDRETWLWPGGHDAPRSRLGLRSIRLTLKRRELLRSQLRALLRAAKFGTLRILFPFVSSVDELREARSVLAEARQDLTTRGESVPQVPIGVMIEVPSAALTADVLASECDFLTLGTNDLIQCCLAVDRSDDRVSHLYEPLHPGVLRLIRHVSRAAHRRRVPLSVCGEMASDTAMLALLIGMGLTEFSMTPAAIGVARQVVRDLESKELRRMAAHALTLTSAPEIEQFLTEALTQRKVLD